MHALTEIVPVLDSAELMARVHVAPATEDAAAFTGLVDQARAVAAPKAIYAESFIEARRGDTVRIDGVTFTSHVLRRNLDGVERVFPYVATCGREMDQVPLPADDVLVQYWWDAIKAEVLNAARSHLVSHLTERFQLGRTSRMSPGSGDADVWPIEQQQPLFQLLGGVTSQIGVILTDSCLMIPNKTVSGILFPTEHDFRTCQVCHREVCPNRTAPFDAAIWASLRQA